MNDRDYAVVVGISRYGSLRPHLEGPERDAKAFEAWLLDPQGGAVPRKNVTTIVSSTFEPFNSQADPFAYEPSLSKVTAAFGKLMSEARRNAGSPGSVGRRLYIYMSGHGLTPKRDPLTTSLHAALAMAGYDEDGNPESFAGLMYANWFRESHAFKEILLFMDCCRDDRADVHLPGIAMEIAPGGNPDQVKTFYAWATRWNSRAWEMPLGTPPEKRGVFTYALLEALRQGTPDRAGRTTPAGIVGHIIRRIPELRNGDSSQGPQFDPERPDDSIVLLAGTPSAAPGAANVTITFADALMGKTATLLDRDMQPGESTVISTAPWPLTLSKGVHAIMVDGQDYSVIVRQDGESVTKVIDV